jgi:two-component system sensor histidine kinase KdpD
VKTVELLDGGISILCELVLCAVADEVADQAADYRARDGLDPALIPERVMVCMSSSAMAARVLRTGARIAGKLGARWYAVYVETPAERPDRIRRTDADALMQNIALADRLGATVVRVRATRPADGLVAFARREGITRVIFGQSARSRWELVMKGSTIDRFLAEVKDAAVQVVPPGGAVR